MMFYKPYRKCCFDTAEGGWEMGFDHVNCDKCGQEIRMATDIDSFLVFIALTMSDDRPIHCRLGTMIYPKDSEILYLFG